MPSSNRHKEPLLRCKDCGVAVPCDAHEWPSLPLVVVCHTRARIACVRLLMAAASTGNDRDLLIADLHRRAAESYAPAIGLSQSATRAASAASPRRRLRDG